MDNKKREQMLSELSRKLGKSSDEIMQGVQSGNIESLISGLGAEQKSRINNLLANPELAKKLMQDEKVQDIIRKLES